MLDVFRYGRTSVAVVIYALFLRHLGMSLRKIARAMSLGVITLYGDGRRSLKALRMFSTANVVYLCILSMIGRLGL